MQARHIYSLRAWLRHLYAGPGFVRTPSEQLRSTVGKLAGALLSLLFIAVFCRGAGEGLACLARLSAAPQNTFFRQLLVAFTGACALVAGAPLGALVVQLRWLHALLRR